LGVQVNLREVMEKMSYPEKKTILALRQLSRPTIANIAAQTELDQATVMRAALSLYESGLVEILEEKSTKIKLTPEGEEYSLVGLPERRMLLALAGRSPEFVDEIAARTSLSEEQKNIALTWLKRRGWAEFTKKDGKTALVITAGGSEAVAKKSNDEKLIELISDFIAGNKPEDKKIKFEDLPANLRGALRGLTERKLVSVDEEIQRELELTELGNQALDLGIELMEEVSELTHELLVSGRWRETKLKRYDVVAPGVPAYPGKIHPQQQVVDELREILLEMGFVEIKSRIVESEFWNFDALFQAQDHPAREIHDSLSLSKPAKANLPPLPLVKRVAAAHERGIAGSTGWGYKFNPDTSQKTVLCSQTTAATVRYLASHPDPPQKVFCIDRVYRHEKIDYKHLAEFYQAEGIVMNPDLTLRDMLGYLKQIMVKLGLPKIRFRPGYFPYTEPSVEADVYFPEKQEWLEALGAGMFRPELLRPLGIDNPVLAWGIGFSRLSMIRLEIDDIRDLFKNDLEWIHTKRMI